MIDRKSGKCTGLIDSFLLTEETQVIFMHYKKALTNSSKPCRGSKSVRNFDDESISKSEKIDFILYVCRMPTGESISILAWSSWFSSYFSTTESAIILSPKKRDCEIKIGEAWFGGWLMEMTHLPECSHEEERILPRVLLIMYLNHDATLDVSKRNDSLFPSLRPMQFEGKKRQF